MREGRIIFPVEGPLNEAVQKCLHNITHVFGGCTLTEGSGYWLHPNGDYIRETVRIADIAYEPTVENDAKLYDLAWDFLHAANQVEVYVRYANGFVQMVTHKSCMDNGEPDWNAIFAGRLNDDVSDIPDEPAGVDLIKGDIL